MKKFFVYASVILAFVMTFSSCENENDPNPYCYEFTTTQAALVGFISSFTTTIKIGDNAANTSTNFAKMTVADKNSTCKAGTNEITVFGIKTKTTVTARKVNSSACE